MESSTVLATEVGDSTSDGDAGPGEDHDALAVPYKLDGVLEGVVLWLFHSPWDPMHHVTNDGSTLERGSRSD